MASAPRPAEIRASTSSRKGPLAPDRDSDPSSSWSNAASTLTCADVVGRGEQGDEAGVHRAQVVHAARREELVLAAEPGRRRGVGHQHVVTGDLVDVDAGDAGEVGEQVDPRPGSPDGLQVPLTVEREALVHLAVQVDRELRDARERAGAHEVLDAVRR